MEGRGVAGLYLSCTGVEDAEECVAVVKKTAERGGRNEFYFFHARPEFPHPPRSTHRAPESVSDRSTETAKTVSFSSRPVPSPPLRASQIGDEDLRKAFEEIRASAFSEPYGPSPGEAFVGHLTSKGRSEWAVARAALKGFSPVNKAALFEVN